MAADGNVLDRPDANIVARGKKTIEVVISKAGKAAETLQTTTNEISYLMGTVRLAIEVTDLSDPSDRELQKARLRGLRRMAELRKAADPVMETGAVCEFLGVSRETIRKKVERKQILAIPKGDDRVFPSFQFNKDGEIIDGLAEVLSALDTKSVFVVLSFLLGKNSDFDGKTAIELLQKGDKEPVISEARVFLQHGS